MRLVSRRPSLIYILLCLSLAGCPRPENQAPVASSGLLSTPANSFYTGNLQASDADSDDLVYFIVSAPALGTVTLTDPTTGAFTYTVANGAVGRDRFSFAVDDGRRISRPGVVRLEVGISLSGTVEGLPGAAQGQVVASSDQGVFTAGLDGARGFTFYDLPLGDYTVKAVFEGYDTGPAVAAASDGPSLTWEPGSAQTEPSGALNFQASELESASFVFHWEEDASTAGSEYSSYLSEPLAVEFRDEVLEISDLAAVRKLQHDYNVILSNEEGVWSQEHAYRLLETLRTIPQDLRSPYGEQSLTASKWILADEAITGDIEIDASGEAKVVRVSTAAFENASPRLALVEGRRGKYYSKRLHHAVVRYVTSDGNDRDAVERILNERFGVSVVVDDYAALTAGITDETADRFQSFLPAELVEIINQFEEMPTGMHRIPGLSYLVRRLNGTPHPIYPSAPAVAWTGRGYIEFMEIAFRTADLDHLHRLIIHEKAHFLWAEVFSDQLRSDWIEVGGWYPNAADPDGWSTTRQTEFVSAYAHAVNPNEDMAESISYFVINPDMLRSRSLPKYEFVRDRIMQGNIYISQIQEDMTFEVYNLFPDYVYPGKIKRLDVRVEGEPEQDKVATVEIELHTLGGYFEGAQYAVMRIFSEIGTYVDLYLHPTNASGTILRGQFTLSRYAKKGFWAPDQIVITDQVGNQRFEGVDDFGWKMIVDNPLEDVAAPQYVEGTAQLHVSTDEVSYLQPVQVLTAQWQVAEDREMRASSPCYASIIVVDTFLYRLEEYGQFDELVGWCSVEFLITRYHASGEYQLTYIEMSDSALNQGRTYFTGQVGEEEAQSMEIVTADPDLTPPELDLDAISVSAVPTQPSAPNGETLVSIAYYARDDKSGLDTVRYELRDPQGIEHGEYHYHENFYTLFFEGDPVAWRRYEIAALLPVGSAPGTWGVSSMSLMDKANNIQNYDFTEIIHFDVE